MYDKASRLRIIAGESSGLSKPSQKGDPHFKNEGREMTPTEFLNDAPKDFKCDLHENDKVYTVSFSQLRETKNCLYYIGELGLSNKDFYVAPIYIFKQKSKFANGMMKIVPFVEEEAWSIISGAHFHHQFKDRLREGQRAPDPFLECFSIYFGFDPYGSISMVGA